MWFPDGGIGFVAPVKDESDAFPEMLLIGLYQYETEIKFEEAKMQLIAFFNNNPSVNIGEESEFTLAGNPAYKVTYLVSNPSVFLPPMDLMKTEIITVKDNKVYDIIYTAEPDDFSFYEEIINKMINSLKIK